MGKELELAIRIGGKIDKSLGNAINNAQNQLGGLNSVAGKIAAGVAGMFAVSEIKDFVTDAVDTYKGYQDTIQTTAAVANVAQGSADFEKLSNAAREAGKATVKTAQESAEALGYMALAGWNVDDSCKALQPILKLSTATGAELAYTSDLVTDSMANLGLGINNLNHYLDVSVAANNKSNQTAVQLQEAYLGVGGVLKNLNAPIEESAAVLGVLANRGTKGSEAGTALSAILVNMQKKTGDAAKAMSKLGVSMYDTNGDARSILDVFQDINDKTSGMTEEQRNLMYQMIGGKSHVDSFAKIMAGFTDTAADGKLEVYSLTEAFKNCDGALNDFYDIKTGTLTSAMEVFKSAVDDMKISLVEQFAPAATESIKNMADKMPEITAKISAAITSFIEKSKQAYNFISQHWSGIKTTVTGAVAAILTLKTIGTVVSTVSNVSNAFKVLAGTMKLTSSMARTSSLVRNAGALRLVFLALKSPTGIAVAAITAVVAAIAMYNKAQQEAVKQNLKDHFGDIALSAEECSTYVEKIFSGTTIRRASDIADKFKKVDDHLQTMSEAGAAISKYNWKVNMGLELNANETEDYKSQINSFVQSAISAVEQQHYSLTLSLELLSSNPQLQTEMGTVINSIFGETEGELSQLGKELSDYVMKALEDGIISADETNCITAMQQKIASLTEKLANAKSQAKLDNLQLEFNYSDLSEESFQNLQKGVQEWLSERETSLQSVKLEQLATINMLTEIPQEALDNGFTGSLEEYKEKIRQEIERSFQFEKFNAQIQGIEVSTDGITSAYQETFKSATPIVTGYFDEYVKDIDDYIFQYGGINPAQMQIDFAGQDFGLDKTNKGAISKLFENMKSELSGAEELKQSLAQAGREIPQSLLDGLHNATVIGAAAGDKLSSFRLLGEQLAQQGRTDILSQMEGIGGEMAEAVIAGATGVNGYNVKINTNLEAGETNTEQYTQQLDESAKQAAEQSSNAVNTTVNTSIQAGNIDTTSFQQSLFAKFRNLPFGKGTSQSVNVVLKATDNVTAKANSAEAAVKNIPEVHDTAINVNGNALSKADSIDKAVRELPSSKTITINIEQNGSIPKAASGLTNAAEGYYMLNDQTGISDPREVIETKNGLRYYYEGRNVIVPLQWGSKVYTAAESKAFINGSHAGGLDRVPFDGYIAELHEGERVLTSDEAEDYAENGLFSKAIRLVNEFARENNPKENPSDDNRTIVFSPSIYVNGDADEEKIRQAVKMSYHDFEEFMERYERDKRRKSFESKGA